jgi:putative methionine-R-sulfoxide reductase with GAF domain
LLQLVTKRAQQFQTDAFFVTTKKWRLVVTPLSGTTSLHQLEVEAPNWMGALRAARKEMGEGGGLPSGASCAVAPDGTVTILDSESRRKFLLTPGAVIVPKPAEPAPSKNGKAAELPEKKQAFQTMGYEAVRAIVAPPPARHDLEVLITRDEDPTPDNPLTYRERAYLIPKGMSVSEAEAGLRFTLADLQTKLAATPRGKFVNLAAFDHRWVDQPQRPPLVVLEWRDWRGEPAVDYPAAERAASTAPRDHEPDDRLASVFESLHELAHLRTPAEGLEFIVRLLDTTVPATAIAACLYDINTDELRFVALTGPGEAELRGTAIPRNRGLFGRAASMDQGALLIRSVADEPGYDAVSDGRPGLKPHNMLLRPLVHDGRLLGLLQLIDRTTGAFSAPDQHLVNYAADRLAAFLREARDRVVRP